MCSVPRTEIQEANTIKQGEEPQKVNQVVLFKWSFLEEHFLSFESGRADGMDIFGPEKDFFRFQEVEASLSNSKAILDEILADSFPLEDAEKVKKYSSIVKSYCHTLHSLWSLFEGKRNHFYIAFDLALDMIRNLVPSLQESLDGIMELCHDNLKIISSKIKDLSLADKLNFLEREYETFYLKAYDEFINDSVSLDSTLSYRTFLSIIFVRTNTYKEIVTLPRYKAIFDACKKLKIQGVNYESPTSGFFDVFERMLTKSIHRSRIFSESKSSDEEMLIATFFKERKQSCKKFENILKSALENLENSQKIIHDASMYRLHYYALRYEARTQRRIEKIQSILMNEIPESNSFVPTPNEGTFLNKGKSPLESQRKIVNETVKPIQFINLMDDDVEVDNSNLGCFFKSGEKDRFRISIPDRKFTVKTLEKLKNHLNGTKMMERDSTKLKLLDELLLQADKLMEDVSEGRVSINDSLKVEEYAGNFKKSLQGMMKLTFMFTKKSHLHFILFDLAVDLMKKIDDSFESESWKEIAAICKDNIENISLKISKLSRFEKLDFLEDKINYFLNRAIDSFINDVKISRKGCMDIISVIQLSSELYAKIIGEFNFKYSSIKAALNELNVILEGPIKLNANTFGPQREIDSLKNERKRIRKYMSSLDEAAILARRMIKDKIEPPEETLKKMEAAFNLSKKIINMLDAKWKHNFRMTTFVDRFEQRAAKRLVKIKIALDGSFKSMNSDEIDVLCGKMWEDIEEEEIEWNEQMTEASRDGNEDSAINSTPLELNVSNESDSQIAKSNENSLKRRNSSQVVAPPVKRQKPNETAEKLPEERMDAVQQSTIALRSSEIAKKVISMHSWPKETSQTCRKLEEHLGGTNMLEKDSFRLQLVEEMLQKAEELIKDVKNDFIADHFEVFQRSLEEFMELKNLFCSKANLHFVLFDLVVDLMRQIDDSFESESWKEITAHCKENRTLMSCEIFPLSDVEKLDFLEPKLNLYLKHAYDAFISDSEFSKKDCMEIISIIQSSSELHKKILYKLHKKTHPIRAALEKLNCTVDSPKKFYVHVIGPPRELNQLGDERKKIRSDFSSSDEAVSIAFRIIRKEQELDKESFEKLQVALESLEKMISINLKGHLKNSYRMLLFASRYEKRAAKRIELLKRALQSNSGTD